MNKWEIVHKIATKNNMHSTTIVATVLNELETMGLIKFETEREAVIKEAESYLQSGVGYRLEDVGKYHSLIKRLIALVK